MAKNKVKSVKEKHIFLSISLGIIILFTLIGSFNVFNSIDLRFYNFLFKFKKEIPQNEKVVMIEIDDQSLDKLGEWPWTRNILGDTLIRMKEMGATSASFDIEYLSPSAMGVASNVREKIDESISGNEELVVGLVEQLTDAATGGMFKTSEIAGLSKEMIEEYLYPSYEELKENIVNDIYFDYDEYFARAVQFFENAYLTINMREIGVTYEPEYIDYVNKRFLRRNVQDKNALIKKFNNYEASRLDKDIPGYAPSMEIFMSRAKAGSFTNSVVDDDGIRRRMEFLTEHDGGYIAQLSVSPLLDNLNVEKIIRNKRSYTLVNAKFPDLPEPIDIKIPLDEHGYFLINWRHGNIDDSFKFQPVLQFNYLDTCEEAVFKGLNNISNLNVINEDGSPFDFFGFAQELSEMYQEILEYKNYLLSLCTGFDAYGKPYDGISPEMYEEYFSLRKDYFENIKVFIDQNLEGEVFDFLDYMIDKYSDREDVVQRFTDWKNALSEEYNYLKEEYFSYMEIEPKVRADINGSYCIIGNTASSTTDLGAVPFIKQYANVGIHGNVMNTILNRQFIYSYDWYFIFILSVIFSIIPAFVSDDKKVFKNIYGAIMVLGLVSLFIVLFVIFDIYFPMITSVSYLFVIYLTGLIFRFVNSDREKKYITDAFSQCLAPTVVKQLIDNPDSFRLGGETLDMSAIFTDIQKFSSFSELLNAGELVALLNFYLTEMSDIIIGEDGTVDKYEGDAIIALVGAPFQFEDHAFKACSAAIKMKKAEELINQKIIDIASKEKPEDMDIDLYNAFKVMTENKKTINTRIGINSGEMVAGYMGSTKKKNYTMMGNNVNLASRLEGTNKAYASYIMCSESTFERANRGVNKDKILFRRLDRVRVINIKTPVQLYNIIGFTDDITNEQRKEIDMFHAALDLYLERNFIEAGKLFVKANSVFTDDTALVYAERCKNYIEEGVPENWDGIFNMTSK
ncbi:MAG: CHASE2 domain-containing protein [Treponema sp.]|nr:CHASE2 domain-containing protein [Treponema sp.]